MAAPKNLLVQCITLMCLERLPNSPASPSNELIDRVIKSLEVKDGGLDNDTGRKTFLELRDLASKLAKMSDNDFPTISEVLANVRVSAREESYLYDAVAEGVNEPFPDGDAIMRSINNRRGTLKRYLNEVSIKQIIRETSQKLLFNNGASIDVRSAIMDMGVKLDPFIKARDEEKHPAEMNSLDFDNLSEVEEQFEQVQTKLSPDGAFRTGWKGFNNMCGELKAIRRGEFIVSGGIQHSGKSLISQYLFSHLAIFNKPWMRDASKRPLLLFVTFENETSDNLLTIYKYVRENETGEEVDLAAVDRKEASAYIASRLKENGFAVKIIRFDPTSFSASAFVDYLDGLQAQGFELQYLEVDYLNMLPKTGLEANVAGDDIRLLFRRLRNYCAPRGITFHTPHQLGSQALDLLRENTEDFVKVVAGKGYWDGCRRLSQEPDLEFFHHIVRVKGKAYMAIQRGKHRNVNRTPLEDQYFLLPFEDIGTLRWDVDKEEEYFLKQLPNASLSDGDSMWDA